MKKLQHRMITILLTSICLVGVCGQTPLQAQDSTREPRTAVSEQVRSISVLYEDILDKFETLKPKEGITIKIGTEKDTYAFDELVEIRFQVSHDCYATLMDVSEPDYDIKFFFPNKNFPEVKLQADRVYSTYYDFNMRIKARPPQGIESLNLFCTTEKFDLFDVNVGDTVYYTVAADNEKDLSELLERLDALKQTEWTGKTVQLIIGQNEGTATIIEGNTRAILKKGAIPPIGATGSTGKFFPPLGTTGTTGKQEGQ